jgi:hypothetical protein
MNQSVFVTVGDVVILTRSLESFAGCGILPQGTQGIVHRLSDPFALVEFVDDYGESLAAVYVDTRSLHVVEPVDGEPLHQALLEALQLVGYLYTDNRKLKAAASPLSPSRLAGRPQFEQCSFEHVTDELAAALTANGYAKVSETTTGGPEVWARLRVNGKG